MNIDKKRFLALTGVIAAASGIATMQACSLTVNGGDPDGAAPIPTVDSSSQDPDGSASVDSSSPDSSTRDATTADAADGATCLGDDKMLNPPCASFVNEAGTSCAGSPVGQSFCPASKANFVNGVSREIMECLKLAPTCEAVPNPLESCTYKALDRACVVPAAKAPCQQALMNCTQSGVTPTIDQAKCERYYSGLSPQGQLGFQSCTSEGCGLIETSYCFLPGL